MSVEVTWLGHASWLLESGEHRILIDPFLTDNPAAKAKPEEVAADFILLTHGHFDHVADAAAIANRCQATLVANFEVATWFAEKQQVKKTLGMNLGGSVQLPFGRLQMTLAWHSSQMPDGSYGGNPGGFVIETGERRLYFAGDTALFSDMKLIASGGLDVAVLPIGDLFTMGPDDSLEAIKLLSPQKVMPAHYDTWPPIQQDATAWAERVSQETEAQAIVPVVGEPVLL